MTRHNSNPHPSSLIPHPSSVVLGVDVGGTRISAGLVTREGQVLSSLSLPCRAVGGDCITTLKQATHDLLAQASTQNCSVLGIGVGIAGAVNFAAGTVSADALNLPELANVSLRDVLQDSFGLPVVMDNDVNALALGEMLFGKAQGVRDFVTLALGTGVGGAIVAGGQLLRGVQGFAGEIGHMTVQLDGRPCFCGSRGCLKAYVAGPDIVAQAWELQAAKPQIPNPKSQIPFSDAAEVFLAAQQGDAIAAQVVEQVTRALGAAIGNVINIFNPEMVVLGGSVAHGLAFWLDEVKRWAEYYALSDAFQATRIELSALDKDSALLGPAALFFSHGTTRKDTEGRIH